MSLVSLNKAQHDAPSHGNPNKSSIAELKNGKVVFKQKPMLLDKNSETMQGVVKFREYLEQLSENNQPVLTIVPSEHMPVIAKLAHESDKTLSALAKYIAKELAPTHEDEDDMSASTITVSTQVIETAVKSALERNNYGLDGLSDTKLPASVCVWRWEVKQEFKDWLPKSVRAKAESRKAERIQAKEELRLAFEALPSHERNSILPSKSLKTSLSDANAATVTVADLTKNEGKAEHIQQKGKAKANDGENDQPSTKQSPAKKIVDDPEKAAKEKARQEKKAAKEEKEKRERESQNRSRSLMANFFAKAKLSPSSVSPSKDGHIPSTSQTEFDRVFKQFVVKKDATIAPTNWFTTKGIRHGKLPIPSDVIVITDDEDDGKTLESDEAISMDCDAPCLALESLTQQARLDSVIQSMSASRSRPRSSLQYKSHNPISVRAVMNQLSEAEVAGDDVLVRSLLSKLPDRILFPAKVLIFADDIRPGYFGTFTRNSRTIGPRSPLSKDIMMVDYSYDSGEEWEAENPNDADDVVEDGEEDDDSDSADSDLDSWLVDDDEDEPVPIDLDENPSLSVEFPEFPLPSIHSPPKRKAEQQPKKKLVKKRKVVVPLVPYSKGPYWESVIGHCQSDTLKPYRIQLFNDTPLAVDPFTFISKCAEAYASATKLSATQTAPPTTDASTSSALMPPPPPPSTVVKRTSSTPKPKTTFPDAHLPFLFSKITSLQAPTITYLVDAVFKDLRSQNVKKNAIEAKVREVSERCKEKKYWVVKPSMLGSHSAYDPIPSS